MELRHCGQDKRMFLCPVHNASTLCSLQAFGIRCITSEKTMSTECESILFSRLMIINRSG